ncbi:hypothetical protein LUZ61_008955 [Rhynchospora tenuis]|uniref:Late embryogenesis abundant protein LEA-2 subgroup domain-containing protein n=1 Tax=Rhynchospora tenuis TaxID=198213 RepID=A0AAD6EY41_9POAL|nr:hypothetical protein LUZ61_008955 [Rhynchospora tenuis]
MQTQPEVMLKPSAPPIPMVPLPLHPLTAPPEPIPKKKPKTCLKVICCLLLIIIVLIAVFMFFALYLFKKRDIQITANNLNLEDMSFTMTPITLNMVFGINIGIKNPNYAGFKYESTNTTILYHGLLAGISPMPAGMIKARSSKTMHNTIYIIAATIVNSPFLLPELVAGKLLLTSKTSMVGKVVLFNNIKIHATVDASCDIIVDLQSQTMTSNCNGNVKMS